MVKLERINNVFSAKFPKNLENEGILTIIFTSMGKKVEIEVSEYTSTNDFFNISFESEDLADKGRNEWEYELVNESGKVIGRGIAITDYERYKETRSNIAKYNNNDTEYLIYDEQ